MKKWTNAALAAALAIAAAGAAPAPMPEPSAVPAPDAAPTTIDVTYDVSLLGLSVGSMKMKLDLEDGRYRAEVYVQPEGLAATFAPNTISAVATGRAEGGHALPDQSWVRQSKSDGARIVQITYAGGEIASMSVDPAYKPFPYAPSESDRRGTTDALSGLISMLLMPTVADASNTCGDTLHIFDGKRRYDFMQWSGGARTVAKGAGGYRGPAIYCVGTYRRIAGWRPDRISPEYDTKIHGWYAPIGPSGGTPVVFLPVRLWGESNVGDVVAVPTSVAINGRPWQEFFSGG